MNAKKNNLLAILLFTVSVYLVCCIFIPDAQAQKTAPPSPPPNAVILDGKTLFIIPKPLGNYSAQVRANSLNSKLVKIEQDPKFDPESINISDTGSSTEIIAGDIILTSINDADCKSQGLTRQALAQQDADKFKAALQAHKAKQVVQGAIQAASPQNIRESLISFIFQPVTFRVIVFALGFLMISFASSIVRHSVTYYIADSSKRFAISKLISICTYGIAALLALVVFREVLGNLAVVLGAAAAGIAFALQELIVSIAGWVGITTGDYFKIGDRVEMSGIKGDVIDIGLVRTTLMEISDGANGDLYTGRVVRISNSFVFKNPLFNYSRDFGFLWDEVVVSISAGADIKAAHDTLQKIVDGIITSSTFEADSQWSQFTEKYATAKADVKPAVTLSINGDKAVFTVRYAVDYRERRKMKDLLYRRISEEFTKSNGKLSFVPAA